MADFISNQEELERLSKEAQQAQLEKSAATDRLKQGMAIGGILGLPRSANKAEIMTGMQPNNAGRQAVQQAWERPAALEQQTASQNYQDILNKYKTLKETGLKDYQLSLEAQKAKASEGKIAETERHNREMEKLAINKMGEKAPKFTKGQEAADVVFGKDYADYKALGGYTGIKKQLDTLDNVVNSIDSGNVKTGAFSGLVQKTGFTGSLLDPSVRVAQQQIADVVQSTLRPILGSQFTENEGTRILQQSFDPSLPTKENARRVKALKENLIARAKAKDEAIKYFEENGTLSGFSNPDYNKTANEMIQDTVGSTAGNKSKGMGLINNAEAAAPTKSREQMIADIKAKMAGGQ